MTELKIQHLLTLSYLLSKGAKYNYVTITTSALGKNINKSQQAASKHLLELEQNKFINRIISGRNLSVKITGKGYSEIVKLSSLLQKSLDSSPSIVIDCAPIFGIKTFIPTSKVVGAYSPLLKL